VALKVDTNVLKKMLPGYQIGFVRVEAEGGLVLSLLHSPYQH
jgi:hypothetical protein